MARALIPITPQYPILTQSSALREVLLGLLLLDEKAVRNLAQSYYDGEARMAALVCRKDGHTLKLVTDWNYARKISEIGTTLYWLVKTTNQESRMRSEEEIKSVRATFERELEEYPDEEALQAIVDVLNWVLGDVDISTLEGHRSI